MAQLKAGSTVGGYTIWHAGNLTPASIGAVQNAGNTPSILANTEANRPAAGTAGRIFIATDTQRIYRDTGSAWVLVGVVNWADVANKPSTFPPSAHKSSHASGGTDALTPADIGAAAASDFAAHLAETVITVNKTINIPGDFATIQDALDSLKKAWIPRGVTVTIQVAAGTYTHTNPIVVDHPCGSQIRIIGATPISTTITGVGTVSGSAGNWNVPITVDNVSGIQVGQYAIIRNTSGTGDHFAHHGIWEITAVDVGTKTVTVKNTHRASTFPTATLSSGDFIVLTTILKFTDSIGIKLYDKALGYLDNIAIVGNNSTSTTVGIEVGYGSWTALRGGSINCGSYVGVNGFTFGFAAGNGSSIVGTLFVASGNGSGGFYAHFSGSICAPYSTASGNGSSGFFAQLSGSIYAPYSTASGNGSSGFCAQYSGSIYAPYSTASGNGSSGFYAQLSSSICASYSTASGNGSSGLYAQFSSSIYAPYSTASGNGTDYKAEKMGYIYCSGYTGTPTFSPALNTVGNYNAIITT